jgi:prepilin-type N-terminal cleavage/methylation domain-containing protein
MAPVLLKEIVNRRFFFIYSYSGILEKGVIMMWLSCDKENHGISIRKTGGFTIVELLVAMSISLIVMAAIFSTFKSQQDSYVVQSQVSVTQQNLRAALFMITRDIQMAGYFTDKVSGTYPFQVDGEVLDGVTIRPLMYARDNVSGITGVKKDTDILVIIKGSDTWRKLEAGEYATPGEAGAAYLSPINNPDEIDLNYISASGHNKFGFLAKKDLNRAEIFEVAAGGFEFPAGLIDNYSEDDIVGKVDVIIYKIEETDSGPTLRRKNLGTDTAWNTIAEDVDDLQFSYILNDGSEIDNPALSDIPKIRAVKVFLLARTDNKIRGYKDPNSYQMRNSVSPPDGGYKDGYMRRILSATVNARNLGL